MKKNYLTQKERLQFSLSPQLKEILIGLILGNLFLQKRSESTLSVRALFRQGLVNKDYLMHLYELFQSYGAQVPKTSNLAPDKRTGKIYNTVSFNTYSLPCFAPLYELFYVAGKKVIPSNIADLLTPLALAYLICDDGGLCRTSKRLILATNCYELAEENLLAGALNNKWNLNCYVNKRGCGYVILIPAKSLPIVQALLKDIMPPMMLYKLDL